MKFAENDRDGNSIDWLNENAVGLAVGSADGSAEGSAEGSTSTEKPFDIVIWKLPERENEPNVGTAVGSALGLIVGSWRPRARKSKCSRRGSCCSASWGWSSARFRNASTSC